MRKFRQFWNKLTAPKQENTRQAILNYFTNLVLFWSTVIFWLVAAVFVLALKFHFAINPALDMPIAALVSAVLTSIGLWISYNGRWRTARYIPVTLMFGLAFYSAYFYGLGVVLLIEISLATLLAVIMWFEQVSWWRILLILAALLAIGTYRLRFFPPNELFYWLSISSFYLLLFTGFIVFMMREYSTLVDRVVDQSKTLQDSKAVIQQQIDHLLMLQNVDLVVISGSAMSEILQVIVENLKASISIDACCILLWDAGLGFEFGAAAGFNDEELTIAQNVSLTDSIFFELILNRKEIVVSADEEIRSPRLMQLFAKKGFTHYRALRIENAGEVVGALEFFHRQPRKLSQKEQNLVFSLVSRANLAIQRIRLVEDLQLARLDLEVAYLDTLKGWVKALDLRDEETEHHAVRVTAMTQQLAEKMGVEGEDLVIIGRGALLHDIGKMAIPDMILNKPGPLDPDEMGAMKRHPEFAYEFLKSIDYLRPVLDIPYCHHERWDGTGYPRGLAGEEIPLAARIFAVVDVWDALLSARPYRKAWAEEDALRYIREQSGSHFDPAVVDTFFAMMDEMGENFMTIRDRLEEEEHLIF